MQTAVLGACFLALYVVFARETLHPPDAARWIQQAHAGDRNEHHHFLYNRIACATAAWAASFGVSAFVALRALSAVGGALAVVFAHRAFLRSGLAAPRAAIAAALVGSCPALGYYATTVEIHALHLASVALAFWSLAAAAESGGGVARGLLGAARTGLLTGLAATIHSTGHLLVFVAVLPSLRQRRPRQMLALLGAHLLASTCIARLAGEGVFAAQAVYFGAFLGDPPSAAAVARSVWSEWLVALAPLSWLGILACVRGRLLAEARWLHLTCVPFLVTAVVLLRGEMLDHGSYPLPCAVPLAWLVARLVEPRVGAAFVALGFSITWLSLPPTDTLGRERRFCDAVVALDRAIPVHVVGVTAEVDAVVRWATGIPADSVFVMNGLRGGPRDALPALATAFDERMAAARAMGRVPLLTAAGAAWLGAAPGDLLWRLRTEHIEVQYRLERLDRGALEGWLLRPRP